MGTKSIITLESRHKLDSGGLSKSFGTAQFLTILDHGSCSPGKSVVSVRHVHAQSSLQILRSDSDERKRLLLLLNLKHDMKRYFHPSVTYAWLTLVPLSTM